MCPSIPGRQPQRTTTLLVQVTSSDICCREESEAEFHHLHMAWVLVPDTKGGPQPRLHWLVD
jgi:hypothetical protein